MYKQETVEKLKSIMDDRLETVAKGEIIFGKQECAEEIYQQIIYPFIEMHNRKVAEIYGEMHKCQKWFEVAEICLRDILKDETKYHNEMHKAKKTWENAHSKQCT